MSINKVAISGNLGADPELRSTSSGKYVLTFNVAVNERVPDGNGGWSDRANWIEVTVLRYRTWEKGGRTYSKVGVVADEVDLMSARSAEAVPDTPYAPDDQGGVYDDDISF